MTGENRIMIYGPKDDGTLHFQERMPYGLYVPDEYPEGFGR